MGTAQREAKTRSKGQSSLFGADAENELQNSPGIPLETQDASEREKAAWEKDLMGVALSYNPLVNLSNTDAHGAAIALDQLTQEAAGQQTTILGIVQTVTQRLKKDGEPFLVVTMEMLGGTMETTVWPDVLEHTRPLWETGRAVRVTGRTRAKGDQLELTCDNAWDHPLDGSEPAYLAEGSGAEDGWTKPGRDELPEYVLTDGWGMEPEPDWDDVEPPDAWAPASGMNFNDRLVKMVFIETGDPQADIKLLREAVGVILEHQGMDRVNIEILTGRSRVLLDLPVVSTGYSEELQDQLEELLGPGMVSVSGEPAAVMAIAAD